MSGGESDQEYLTDLQDRVRELYPIHVLGIPKGRSEFGVPYITLWNGMLKEEGAEGYHCPLPSAVESAVAWFKRARGPGDVLVWRKYPVIERAQGRTVLYMRVHTLPGAILRRHLDKADVI